MKLSRFAKINDYRVFRNFVWPSDLDSFARFNVIYGWNASGKTTLSSLLAHLQNKCNVSEGDVRFEFDGETEMSGSDISAAPDTVPPIRVFNRDFVADTVEAIGSGEVSPIFYIGEENVELGKRIEKLKKDLEDVKNAKIDAGKKAEKTRAKIDRHATEKAKSIKETLRGSKPHANYDKRNFESTVNRLKSGNPDSAILSDEEKAKLHRQRHLRSKDTISTVSTITCDLTDIHREVSELVKRSVVSETIDELVGNPELNAWVQRGLELHPSSNGSVTCEFCRNPLSLERREKLERHFNDELRNFQEYIKKSAEGMAAKIKEFKKLFIPNKAQFYEHFDESVVECTKQIEKARSVIVGILERFRKALEKKETTLFSSVSVFDLVDDDLEAEKLYREAVDRLNLLIQEHKNVTHNLGNEVESACKKLEEDLAAQEIPRWDGLKEDIKTAEREKKETSRTFHNIKKEIADLEKQIVEHRLPAEELNNELKAYLGRDELRFKVKEAGYELARGDYSASDLSEGERTAISFLYFLKSLEDKDFDKEHGIVVIDDPVSSLDANTLFSAFAYMKERTKSCGQLIILTHNFAFFRQIRKWFSYIKGQRSPDPKKRPARFYMLEASTEGQRTAVLTQLDPLLEKFESEYHFLFKKVYETAKSGNNSKLAEFYPVPNIARRLLEAFLSFQYPSDSGGLHSQLGKCGVDESRKTRIERFINTYSHTGGSVEPEHDPSILSETKLVLNDILELIKKENRKHFEEMERLLGQQKSEQ